MVDSHRQRLRVLAASGLGHGSFLIRNSVAPATQRKYRAAVAAFTNWAEAEGFDAVTDSDLDLLLVDYAHDLFMKGIAFSRYSTALCGISWLRPDLRHSLPRAAAALRGWRRLHVTVSHPPLTWELACAIGVRMVTDGYWRHGVAAIIAFDCLLRVGELCALKREDVLDSRDLRVSYEHKGMLLRLAHTKTGANKSVEVLDTSAIALMRSLVTSTKAGGRLFPFTAADFRARLHATCVSLGLSPRYVPHSLRHGGATRYFHVLHMAIADVMYRGRWAAHKSAVTYLQSLVALSSTMAVPEALGAFAVRIASDLINAFAIARRKALSSLATATA